MDEAVSALDGHRPVSEFQLIDSTTRSLPSVVQTDLNRTRTRSHQYSSTSTSV